jgi:hypothetical protein
VSLANRLATPPAPKTPQTVMDRWLDSLNETDREAVLAAVVNPEWRHVDLLATLIDEGAPAVADTTFGTWRRKQGLK